MAEWIEEKVGILVPELEHKQAESLPFIKQPSGREAGGFRAVAWSEFTGFIGGDYAILLHVAPEMSTLDFTRNYLFLGFR